MKISIVLNRANKSWIIEKIATRLSNELAELDVAATVSEQPSLDADIIHHMSWAFAQKTRDRLSTMFITHLDDTHKLAMVRKTLLSKTVDIGICMSSDTMQQLVENGAPQEQLTFISPAHDGRSIPRRIIIGLTTRLYPDGRKRESLLLKAASAMALDAFEFQIFGSGWQEVVPVLEKAGAHVVWHQETPDYAEDYNNILAGIPHFDYYMYLGLDEGSLGTLDALNAGVKTIVTPQGFHLDLPGGITHSVISEDDLIAVLGQLTLERQNRIDSVSGLTWRQYAHRHLELWTSMKNGTALARSSVVAKTDSVEVQRMRSLRDQAARTNARSIRRFVSHASHHPLLRPLRRLVDMIRLKR